MDKEKFPMHEIKVDGIYATGKQYDLEILLPEDNREVIYGVVKDCSGHPIEDAVVKLVEILKFGDKEYRAPISHTFTDKEGDFTFGPLCPDRKYEIIIWANDIKHRKICVKPEKDFDCLKGQIIPKCKFDYDKHCYDKKDDECYKDYCDIKDDNYDKPNKKDINYKNILGKPENDEKE